MMQMKMVGKVMGAKRFSGQIDGRNFDYCRMVVATPMDESQGNAVGMTANEYEWGGSQNFIRFEQQQFPFDAELTVEIVSNGKTQKVKIVDWRPIHQQKAEVKV